MKAWVLHSINDIRYEEAEVPLLEEGEVRVRVKAAGICGSDIPRIYKTGAHKMPLIPGHEFSGVVEAVGKGASTYWMGKRVGIYPLIPCGKCKPCTCGHPEMCRNYDYVGSRRDGAFGEYVAVPVSSLIELPDEVSFEQAAMLEPMAVAAHAMIRGVGEEDTAVSSDARIAVCGLGTVGLLFVMFLIDRGYRNIYVIGNKDTQKDRAAALGIPSDNFCDSRSQDVVKWLQDRTGGASDGTEEGIAEARVARVARVARGAGEGVDVFFECVGKNECLSFGIDGAAPGGRVVLVGNPASDMGLNRDVYWKILRNQLTVMGTWNSTFLQRVDRGDSGDSLEEGVLQDDWFYVISRLKSGSIRPEDLISHRFPLAELESGFRIMRDKTEEYCKVIMVNDM